MTPDICFLVLTKIWAHILDYMRRFYGNCWNLNIAPIIRKNARMRESYFSMFWRLQNNIAFCSLSAKLLYATTGWDLIQNKTKLILSGFKRKINIVNVYTYIINKNMQCLLLIPLYRCLPYLQENLDFLFSRVSQKSQPPL